MQRDETGFQAKPHIREGNMLIKVIGGKMPHSAG
jgi:hypothetical protein